MTAEQDCERLVTEFLPLAVAQLQTHGGFYPFAGVLTPEGKTSALQVPVESDQPHPSEVVEATIAALRRNAAARAIHAAVVFADARVLLPGCTEQSDAVQARLDHRDDYSAILFFPYTITDGKVALGKSFVAAGTHEIFSSNTESEETA